MRSATTTPAGRARQEYVDLRLDLVQKLGPSFVNPVQSFIATNGPGRIGALVKFSIFLNAGVDHMQVLRNTANDIASATVLQDYDAQTLPLHQPLSYYDSDTAIIGKKAFYWLRATPQNKQLEPITSGPVAVAVPAQGDTSLAALNNASYSNTTNFATVDSIDAGASATVRIYGTGGVGTSWTRLSGYGATLTYGGGQILGLAYTTKYNVFWTGSAYVAFTTIPPTLPDGYTWAGQTTTVAAGGGGGVPGGGGSSGGGGGRALVIL